MAEHELLVDTRDRMDKATAHTRDMLKNIRTSRASSALVEHVRVEYYGTPTPMSQVAQISVPEPRTLVIKPFDASALKDIEKASHYYEGFMRAFPDHELVPQVQLILKNINKSPEELVKEFKANMEKQ